MVLRPLVGAAKRLTEATGMEAKTVHRLLEVQRGWERLARNENNRAEMKHAYCAPPAEVLLCFAWLAMVTRTCGTCGSSRLLDSYTRSACVRRGSSP